MTSVMQAAVVPAGVRSARIDALKFFAVALVVLSHVANLPQYDQVMGHAVYVIRAVNMPLFMFLSGYVLFGREGTSRARFVGRKAAALLVPYFAWVSIRYALKAGSLADWFLAMGAAALNPHVSGRPWFLYVLFEFYLIFIIVRLLTKRDWALITVALMTIGMTLLPEGDLLGRNNIEWLFTFFVVGYLVAKHRTRMPNPSPQMVLAAAGVFSLLLLAGVLPDKGEGWPPWFFQYLTGLFQVAWQVAKPIFLLWKYATAFAGITFCVGVYCLLSAPWLEWQAFAGRHSLGIYLTQSLLLSLAFGSTVLDIVASTALVVGVSLALALLLEKWTPSRVILLGGARKRRVPADAVQAESLAA